MAKFNLRFTNRLTRHIAGWAPGFALLEQVGRRSGRRYVTPVNAFPVGGQYVFALTYGQSQWVSNVLAAGGCLITTRRHTVSLVDPEKFSDPARQVVPIPIRWILKLVGVDEFVSLRVADEASARLD
jgi:deazaflavin-dependent oxidoreductase (nitroreductase family)